MTAKTDPAPPPLEIFATGTRMGISNTVPCGPPPTVDMTMHPASWEYVPVTEVPPAPDVPASAAPRARFTAGRLVLAVGVLALLVVAALRLAPAAAAPLAATAQPTRTPEPATSHVFVDVEAIVVRPPSHVREMGAAPNRSASLPSTSAPSEVMGIAPIMPEGSSEATDPEVAASPTRGQGAQPTATPFAPAVRHTRRVHAQRTAALRERSASSAPSVTTELDAAVVAGVVGRQQRRLERCYERALTRSGVARAETLRLTVHITPEGAVAAATARGASLPALRSCIEGVALGWAFPASRSGAEVPIPLRFTPQG